MALGALTSAMNFRVNLSQSLRGLQRVAGAGSSPLGLSYFRSMSVSEVNKRQEIFPLPRTLLGGGVVLRVHLCGVSRSSPSFSRGWPF